MQSLIPLVSIISPCYNAENYVLRFLNSVLVQNYDNIELIMINDGSTDRTQEILESYKHRFDKRNYKYVILSQENAGQSEAINKGLEVFSGDYMTWIDSDDALTPDSISKKVHFMESHPEIGLSICKIKIVEFGTYKEIGEQKRIPPSGKDNLFYDLIVGNNVFYTPGGYMVRTSMFREAMPKPLRIQSPREIGQNCQLLLPISFKFPAGYIDDYLFYYSVRKGSHSRVEHSFEEKMKIIEIADIVLKNIANSLSADNYVRENVMRVIRAKTARSKLRALLIYNRKDNVDAYAFSLKELGCYNKNDAVLVLKIKYPLVRCLISLYDKINRRLKFLS